jgi:hypothetical protein
MGEIEGGEERFKRNFDLPILRRETGRHYINFFIEY